MNKFEEKSRKSYNKKAKNYDETLDGKFTAKFKQMLLNEVQTHTLVQSSVLSNSFHIIQLTNG